MGLWPFGASRYFLFRAQRGKLSSEYTVYAPDTAMYFIQAQEDPCGLILTLAPGHLLVTEQLLFPTLHTNSEATTYYKWCFSKTVHAVAEWLREQWGYYLGITEVLKTLDMFLSQSDAALSDFFFF